jgi:acetyltransferase
MSPILQSLTESHAQNTPGALPAGGRALLRPVHAEDAELVQSFVRGLSPQSRRNRFFCALTELPQHMLRRLTQPDHKKEFGLLALAGSPDAPSVVGMAQYAPDQPGCAEFSVAVADAWHGRGLGTRLVQSLIRHASGTGVETLCAVMLPENRAMLALAERLGFALAANAEPGLLRVEKPLARGAAPRLAGALAVAWS